MGRAFAEWLAGVAGVAAGIETGWADLLFSVVILAGFIAVALLFSKVIFRAAAAGDASFRGQPG